MTREQMMDTMIRRFGFEHEAVIEFCKIAEDETISLNMVTNAFCVFSNFIEACIEE